MKRFFGLTLLLFGTMFAICGLVIISGRSQSTPDVLQKYGITRCNDRLCFMGIAPGITSWSSVLDRFAADDPNKDNFAALMIPIDRASNVDGTLSSSSDKTTLQIIAIDFGDYESAPELGAIVAEFGAPCLVHLDAVRRVSSSVILEYPSFRVEFKIYYEHNDDPLGSINPSLKIQGIFLNDGQGTCVPIGAEIEDSFSTHWLGFTSLEYYNAHDISHPRSVY